MSDLCKCGHPKEEHSTRADLISWHYGEDGELCDCTKFEPVASQPTKEIPTIVCLCGSTRFSDAFRKAQLDETLAGKIVLTIGCNMKSDANIFSSYSEQELTAIKMRLDELHKRKIDLADEVLILNVGGYIGSSTKSELEYARAHGKIIRFLEAQNG